MDNTPIIHLQSQIWAHRIVMEAMLAVLLAGKRDSTKLLERMEKAISTRVASFKIVNVASAEERQLIFELMEMEAQRILTDVMAALEKGRRDPPPS